MKLNTLVLRGRGPAAMSGRMVLFCTAALLTLAVAARAGEVETKGLRLFYQQNCAGCHGADGAGHGADGKALRGLDFTDEQWRKTTRDDQMVKVILGGKFFGLAMPAYKAKLTREEAQKMVAEILRKAVKGEIIDPLK